MLEKLSDNRYLLNYFRNYRQKLFATLNLEQAIANRPLFEVIDNAEGIFTAKLRSVLTQRDSATIPADIV